MSAGWSSLRRLPGALGLACLLLTAAWIGHKKWVDPIVVHGEPQLGGTSLRLSAGDTIDLGEARAITFDVERGAAVELEWKTPAGSWIVYVGEVIGLYDGDLRPVGTSVPMHWQTQLTVPIRLSCDDDLALEARGQRIMWTAMPKGCTTGAVTVRATRGSTLDDLTLDGRPLTITERGFDRRLLAGLGLLVFGLSGWELGLLAPLALYADRAGLPPATVCALVFGAALVAQAQRHRGVRRLLASAGVLVSLGLAIRFVLPSGQGEPPPGRGSPPLWVDEALLRRKVAASLARNQSELASARAAPTWLAALGSSATRDGPSRTSWPAELAVGLPVVNLAIGGATSWHMAQVLSTGDLRPPLCAVYLGNNDRMPSMPGVPIAALLRGQRQSGGWVAPVDWPDLIVNISAIRDRCGRVVAMAEFSERLSTDMHRYDATLRTIPGVLVADARKVLAAMPSSAMIDGIHPADSGQRAIARLVEDTLGLATDRDPEAPVRAP